MAARRGAFALWVDGHRLELVGADGSGRAIVDDRVRGGAAWSPDGSRVVYPRQLEGTDVITLWEIAEEDEGAIGISGAARADPEFSPSGQTVVYTRSDPRDGQRVIAWLTGEQHSSTRPPDVLPVHVDWQPCVPGVTVSCTSVAPPFSLPVRKLSCSPSPYVLHVTSGRDAQIRLRCPAAHGYEIVTPPAHGTATGGASLTYRAQAGYVGPDTLSYRALAADGRVSDPIPMQLNVIAPRVKPAAPS